MPKVTEIRVHGVSGTPPRFMLRTDPLLAGRRPESGEASEETDQTSPIELSVYNKDLPPHDVVAYNWSKLTSGRPRQALWLLLLPYTLLNAAGWMLPPRQRDDNQDGARGVLTTTQARWLDVAIRVAGGVVTGLFTVFSLAVLIDLLGAKCRIGSDVCDSLAWLPEFSPPLWLLIATFLSIAATALLGVGIGLEPGRKRQSQTAMQHLEAVGGVELDDLVGESDPAARLTITNPDFWRHRPLTTYLVLIHIGIAALIASWVLASIRRHTSGISPSYWVAVAATVIVFGILVLASSRRLSSHMPRLAWSALIVGIAAWLVSVIDAFGLSDTDWGDIEVGAAISQTAVWLVLVITAIGLIVWLIGGVSKALTTSGSSAMIVVGGLVGTSFGAGIYTLVQRALAPGAAEGVIEPMPGMDWPAFLFLVYLLLLVGAAVWTMARDPLVLDAASVNEGLRTVTTKVRGTLGWPAGLMLAGAAGFVTWTFLKEGVETQSPFVALETVSRVTIVGLSLAVLAGVIIVVGRYFSVKAAAMATAAIAAAYGAISAGWLTEINVLGAVVRFDSLRELTLSIALLVPVAFITSRLFSMVRNRDQRRGVAILWDLASFWPRWYHPFGAPTYGPVAVPDLAALVREEASDGGVVLAAHSQGSVISMAALLTIPPGDPVWDRLAYLTYGNPTCHLYSKLFGGHFTDAAFSEVSERLGGAAGSCEGAVDSTEIKSPRWRNLWRQSDPIGGDIRIPGVTSEALQERIEDGHSAYEATNAFRSARDELKATVSFDL